VTLCIFVDSTKSSEEPAASIFKARDKAAWENESTDIRAWAVRDPTGGGVLKGSKFLSEREVTKIGRVI
jgi:hypothetical protein